MVTWDKESQRYYDQDGEQFAVGIILGAVQVVREVVPSG